MDEAGMIENPSHVIAVLSFQLSVTSFCEYTIFVLITSMFPMIENAMRSCLWGCQVLGIYFLAAFVPVPDGVTPDYHEACKAWPKRESQRDHWIPRNRDEKSCTQ
jgi:hypothetical protein